MRCHYTVQTKQFCHKNKLPHSLRASASLCSRKSLVQCASKAVRLFSNFPCVRKCCENYDFCLCINSAWPHEDCKKFSYQILIALQIAIFFFFFDTQELGKFAADGCHRFSVIYLLPNTEYFCRSESIG